MSLYERMVNKRKVTMFSYPRSGSNWASYCIENINGLKVIGSDNNVGGSDVEDRLEGDDLALIHKSHGGKEDWDMFFNNNKDFKSEGLLFMIRNYKESILNHQGYNKPNYPSVHPIEDMKPCLLGADNETNAADYLRMVQKFDEYNGPKILIDYDDFILNTKEELDRIIKWLSKFGGDYDVNKINDFMDNIVEHKNTSINMYNGTHGQSATNGDPKKLKIQKNTWLTDEIEKEIDSYVENCDTVMYDKYLKRYKL